MPTPFLHISGMVSPCPKQWFCDYLPFMNLKKTRILAALTLALCASLSTTANAQEPSREEEARKNIARNPERNYLSLSYENDLIGGGSDQFYTNGVRLTYFNVGTRPSSILHDLDPYIPFFDINATTSTFFTLGQNMYTPSEIDIADEQVGDRPWAGFLYGSIGMVSVENNHIDELELTLGVVGPQSLAEQTQKMIHRHVTDSPIPKGWGNQLDFEPGIIVSWQRRWPSLWHYDLGDYRLAAQPNINVSLGNIYTYAGTGLMFAFGPYQGYLQDTPPRVRPAVPGSGYFETPDQGWSWYVFAGADGRAVARNIFLDGNTFKDSYSVDKEYFVRDLTAGIAFTLGDYRLTYSYNDRSDEFKGQKDKSTFGSLTLSTRF